MPQFDPELVQLMRTVLEGAMTRVPLEISGSTTKADWLEVILKAASQGETSYSDRIAAATAQIRHAHVDVDVKPVAVNCARQSAGICSPVCPGCYRAQLRTECPIFRSVQSDDAL